MVNYKEYQAVTQMDEVGLDMLFMLEQININLSKIVDLLSNKETKSEGEKVLETFYEEVKKVVPKAKTKRR